jgi:hypothetical protein
VAAHGSVGWVVTAGAMRLVDLAIIIPPWLAEKLAIVVGILAMMATLLMAGSAFAENRHLTKTADAFAFGPPATTNNDDACDISVAPAATLLLPYFEVDTVNRTTATLFTITNVSRFPQIAHVTLWTDWSFPVLDFNIFLTGYDVQPINLADVISGGVVAPPNGTSSATAPGNLSAANSSNPNFLPGGINCANLPGLLPATIVAALKTALTTGNATTYCPSNQPTVGGVAASGFAHGYLTVDVASNCSTNMPNVPAYFTNDILFDNVLIGDYEQIGPGAVGTVASPDAGGTPMVHIRAVPEGGPAGSVPGTNLPYTFYDRYTATLVPRTIDRRQPLPSTFAARYIQGGPNAFATNYKIWREGFGIGLCDTVRQNAMLLASEVIRFDERENLFTFEFGFSNPANLGSSSFITTQVYLPVTSVTNTASPTYPPLARVSGSVDVGGWMYLNLNNGRGFGYSAARPGFAPPGSTTTDGPRASQNWVVIEMFGNAGGGNRLTVDFDAAWLGNGCSPAAFPIFAVSPGPAGGVPVCPAGVTCPLPLAYVGTNQTP